LATEKVAITTGSDEEVGVVESATRRPQRQKGLPQYLKNYEIDLARFGSVQSLIHQKFEQFDDIYDANGFMFGS